MNVKRLTTVLALGTTLSLLTVATVSGLTGPWDRAYAGGYFKFNLAATPAGFLESVEGGSVQADVVSLQSPNAPIGVLQCNVRIMFMDAQGFVLHTADLSVGPGETGSVELPLPQTPSTGRKSFRVTFQVIDDDNKGQARPCVGLPSVHVFEKKSGKTAYYLPIVTN